MLTQLYPSIALTAEQAASIVSDDEFMAAQDAHNYRGQTLFIPVKITLDPQGQFVGIQRTKDHISPRTVGKNPVIEGELTTFDALMTPVVPGAIALRSGVAKEKTATFLLLPFVAPAEGWQDYVNANFRLKAIYLPCNTEQPANTYQSMMYAHAWIDVDAQKVVRLDAVSEALPQGVSVGTLLRDIPATEHEPHMIVVTCFLANGGCCFERAIR